MTFKLSIDKKGKDQFKADYCNAFIGIGLRGTSTAQYLKDAVNQSIVTNHSVYLKSVIPESIRAFVSVNGNNKFPLDIFHTTNQLYKECISAVLANGGSIIMDLDINAYSNYNKSGEGVIQDWIKETYNIKPIIHEHFNEFKL